MAFAVAAFTKILSPKHTTPVLHFTQTSNVAITYEPYFTLRSSSFGEISELRILSRRHNKLHSLVKFDNPEFSQAGSLKA